MCLGLLDLAVNAVETSLNQPKKITAAELEKVLEQAREESWTAVSFISPRAAEWGDTVRGVTPSPVYVIEALPKESVRIISGLKKLSSLGLVDLQIGAEGARALASLSALTSLHLSSNEIGDEGARALASLSALTSLHLSSNKIGDEGARALASLSALTSLHLSSNKIGDEGARALLEAWIHRPTSENLSFLGLQNNGDLSSLLPSEALQNSDAQSILAAYRRYRSAAEQKTLRPLNEAKLLVVGNEAVGKTSLIRYLVENAPRNPSEPKTPGTAIHEQIDTRAWLASEGGVTLNIWDFGGQEIMHGTHRFFLTARSLYLLVLEDRRQDDRSVYDWLKTIRNRGHESPVIVVINKSDEGQQDLRLDESRLRKDYPSIVAFVRTSCDPGDFAAASIQRLREVIAEMLANDERLKHVRDPIPEPWLRVKSAVAQMAREQRVLARRDFERLCEQPGSEAGSGNSAISDSDEQRALLRLLHDLGVVFAHGLERDAPSANREITLLDPNWLTGAIYTLLNSPTVRDQGGEFRRAQMVDLLDADIYPKDWHEFILGMMQDPEVGLCFELPGSDHERYLVPEAMPANEPDYDDVWPSTALRFLYKYDFLPPGLIPRFIVQAHRNLTKKRTRWRTGVLLGAAGCKVLVRGDRDQRRIDIQVAGPAERQRAALNVVLNDLEYVHGLNPEIGAKARVPLPDQPEVSVSYQHLLNFEERNGLDYEYYPEEAERSYTVRELLQGVRRDTQTIDLADKRRKSGDPSGDGGRIEGRQPMSDGDPSKVTERPRLDLEAFKIVVPFLLFSIVVIVSVIAGAYQLAPDAAPVVLGVGILLVVIMLSFAAVFAGVFGEKTTERIVGFILPWERAERAEREAQRQLIQVEIERARKNMRQVLQLPKSPFRREGIELAHRLKQSTTISGDFYQLIPRQDGTLGIYLVDVEGHGLTASQTAQDIHRLLTDSSLNWGLGEPREQLRIADRRVSEEFGDRKISATMCFAEIDPVNKIIRFANAGMPYPLLFRRGESQPEVLRAAGFFVGDGYSRFPAQPDRAEVSVSDGDILVLFSDGIPEAANLSGRTFGQPGVINAVETALSLDPESVADTILHEVERHSGEDKPADDQSLLVVRIGEPPAEPRRARVEVIRITETPDQLEASIWNAEGIGNELDGKLRPKVHAWVGNDPPEFANNIWAAIWEAVANAVKHGSERGDLVTLRLTRAGAGRVEVVQVQSKRWPEADVTLGERRLLEVRALAASSRDQPLENWLMILETDVGTAIMLKEASEVRLAKKGRILTMLFDPAPQEGAEMPA